MQRVRRDSASSTDSWSIIEQRCSPKIEELSSDEETDVETDEELEIGEEAYDSHDSDIEVENQETEDESEDEDHYDDEEEEEHDEEEEEQDEMEDEEEDDEEVPVETSEDESDEEEQQDLELVSQQEAMSGEGMHFVAPEKIRTRLDSVGEAQYSNKVLFLKSSLICFLVQNVLLLGLMLVSKPISDDSVQSSKVTPATWVYLNDSSLQRCGLEDVFKVVRAKKIVTPTVQVAPAPSWENVSYAVPDFTFSPLWQPTILKTPRPSAYSTTISRMRKAEKTCSRSEKPRSVPKSIFPCKEATKKYNFSALNSIMQKKEAAIKKVWTGKSIQKKLPDFTSFSFGKKKMSQKTASSPKRSPIVTPRQRKFNYKLEITPKRSFPVNRPTTKAIAALPQTPYFPKRKSKDVYQFNFWRGNSSIKKDVKSKFTKKTVLNKAMSVYDSRKKMAKYSVKASQEMRNVSAINRQCKRRDFKKRLQLEDKSHRRRQRLLEYKIEKPCRAVYKPSYPKEKKYQKATFKKAEFRSRQKSKL